MEINQDTMNKIADAILYTCLSASFLLTVLEIAGVIDIGYFWATIAPLMCIAIINFFVAAIICFAQMLMEDDEDINN